MNPNMIAAVIVAMWLEWHRLMAQYQQFVFDRIIDRMVLATLPEGVAKRYA